jgi:hypothetical protein
LPWTGTQLGPLLDLPVTDRHVEVDETILFRLVDGLVGRGMEDLGEATTRRQLGAPTATDPSRVTTRVADGGPRLPLPEGTRVPRVNELRVLCVARTL